MSDDNNNGINLELNVIPKFLDAAMTPVAKEIGERLSDIVSLAFTPIIRAKAKRDQKIKKFLKELDDELQKIPENQITEPKLSVVGPALEELFKYYIDEEHIVNAYKKLIATAMDARSINAVHPIHAWMISHMSSEDAVVYEKLATNKSVVIGQAVFEHNHRKTHCTFVMWGDDSYDIPISFELPSTMVSESLSTLKTIGVVISSASKEYHYQSQLRDFLIEEGHVDLNEIEFSVEGLTYYGLSLDAYYLSMILGLETWGE